MAKQNDAEFPKIFEIEFELPKILKEPIELDDGTTLYVGDRVEHPKYGIGTMIRLLFYKDFGQGVFVDFGHDIEKALGINL
jgi:hypothetical protein